MSAAPSQNVIGCQEFLDLLGRSGLVRPELLKQVAVTASAKGSRPETTQEWATLLLKEGFVTKFHLHHLFKKKWKGFFLHGKYKLLELIGSGGMGKVFVAEHLLLKQHVAVKVLPLGQDQAPGMVERFYREALASISLNHPNIVRAFDVDRSGGLHYLVMEFVDGRDLEEVVSQHGFFTIERAADYARQAALGLQHAHEAGWVHRDVKPGNLLVDRSGTVKLLDLGLARTLAARGRDNLTMNHMAAGAVLGTTNYLSPEQSLSSEVDIRADVYSLGATLYFLLTGRPPFAEGSITQKLIWLQTMEPEAITNLRPDVPHGLELVLRKMMAKRPDDRYDTPAEVAAALAPYAGLGSYLPTAKELGASKVARLQLGLSDLATAMELSRSSAASAPSSTSQAHDPTRMLPPTTPRIDAAPGSTPAPGNFSSIDEQRLSGRRNGASPAERSGYIPPPSASGAAPPPLSPAGALPPPASVVAHAARSNGRTAASSISNAFHVDAPPPSSMTASLGPEEGADGNEVLESAFDEDEVFDTASMQQTSNLKLALAFCVPAVVIGAMLWQGGYFKGKNAAEAAPSTAASAAPQVDAAAAWYVTRDPNHRLFGGERSFDSVARAVAQARPGDHIVLLDAEVLESATLDGAAISAGITIEGDPSRPPPQWTTPLFKGDAAPALDLQSVRGLTVKRIAFQGKGESGPRVETLVRLAGESPNVTLRDVTFENYKVCGVLFDAAGGTASAPVRIDAAEFRSGGREAGRSDVRFLGDVCPHARLENSFFHGPSEAALAVGGGVRDLHLENCRFYRAEAGLRLESTAAGRPFHVAAASCTFAELTALVALPAGEGAPSGGETTFSNCLFYRTLRLEREEQQTGLAELFRRSEGNVRDDLSFGKQAALLPSRTAPINLELSADKPRTFLSVSPTSPLFTAGPQGRPVGFRPL